MESAETKSSKTHDRPQTLRELRQSGWRSKSVKREVYDNFMRMLARQEDLLPGIVGYDDLARMKPTALLVNTSRAGLIEPGALLARLRRGDIFACLDTFDLEPLARAHPLRRLENVFLTSHIAGGSADMHAAAATEVVAKVADFLRGEAHDDIGAARLRTMT